MSASSKLSIIAPQFDTVTGRNDFIELATIQTGECWFGDKYEWAIAYLAAHFISLSQLSQSGATSGGGGPITSKKEGDLSVTFGKSGGNSPTDKDSLLETPYGRQYLTLLNSGGAFIGVTGGNLNGC